MAGVLLAVALVALVAVDLWRDRRARGLDPHPVLTHPRWPLFPLAALLPASAIPEDPALFWMACILAGTCVPLLCERFRLTSEGIECRGAVLSWGTLRMRRTRLFVDVRTTRGQHLLLPRWMDGLGTLARMAGSGTLPEWRTPGASWS